MRVNAGCQGMPNLSILLGGHDLKARVLEGLDDAFRNLFCFLGIHRVVRMIFSGIAKCRRNYRSRLIRIGQSSLLIF